MNLDKTEYLEKVEAGEIGIKDASKEFAKMQNQKEVDGGINDLRTLLEAYDFKVLDDKETTRIQRRLQSQNEGTREQAKAEIVARAENVREYMTKLDTGDDVKLIDGSFESIFNLDKATGVDQKQSYLDMFTGLSLSEQVDWLRKIDEDISMRVEQFNNLIELVGKNARDEEMDHFKSLRTKDKTKYLDRLKSTNIQFEQLISGPSLTNAEKRAAKEQFDELGLEGKQIELDRLKKNLAPNPKTEEFNALNKEWTKGIKKFETLDEREKETVLSEIRGRMREKYQDLLNSCPALTKADLRLMRPTTRGRFDMQLAQACIDYFAETKKLAETAEREGLTYDAKIRAHFNWEGITSLDRQQLLKEDTKGKNELDRYSDDIDHIKFDKKYKEKLDKYTKEGKYGLITAKAAKEYYKWFQEKTPKEKDEILEKSETKTGLDFLQDTLKARRELNKKFEALPDHIKKEFEKKFKEGGFEERQELFTIMKIDSEPQRLDKEFEDKVEKMIEDETLSPKSKDKYLNWFKKLSLTDKIKYSEKSSLDNKQREVQRDIFKDKVLKAAPEELLPKLKKEFLEANLKTRTQKNREWLKDFANMTDEEINQEMKLDETLPESEIPFEVKIFMDQGEKQEVNGDIKAALNFYEAALEAIGNENPKLKKEIEDKIKEIETDLGNYDEEIETGHFEMALDSEIDKILTADTSLSRAQEELTIIEELHAIKWRNELLFQKQANTDAMMDATLKGEEQTVRDLNEAMLEHTDDEKGIIKNAQGELTVSDQKEFDVKMFNQDETSYQKWRSYIAEMQSQPPERRWDSKIKLVHPESRQELNADEYKAQVVDKQRSAFTDTLRSQLLKKMKINPKKTGERTLVYIDNYLSNKNYRKRIPTSAETARKAA